VHTLECFMFGTLTLLRHISRSRDDKIYMNKYYIQIGQLFLCIAKYMHMHFRCLFYNMKILYPKSKVSEHSSWSRAARQPAKSRRFATPGLYITDGNGNNGSTPEPQPVELRLKKSVQSLQFQIIHPSMR